MNNLKATKGWIELICGPMFAGKTEELLRKINRASYATLETIIFKPSLDSRNKNVIKSRSSQTKKAIEITHPFEIYDYLIHLKEKPRIIALDEIQFFDLEIIEVANNLANNGFIVMASGLDLDFRGTPFQVTAQMAALAEVITKLSAICTECGEPGTITQKFIDGKPASYNSDTILIGNIESYSVRCRKDHEVLNKPLSKKTLEMNQKKWKD